MPRSIDSPQNPIIKATAKLRTRRAREQTGLIIIDGEREIERAVDGGIQIEQLFVPSGYEIELPNATIGETLDVSPRAHAKIAFGERNEPVATAKRPTTSLEKMIVGDNSCFVVAESIEKPGNIGAIMRSADGAGAAGLILIDPIVDPFSPNALRASLGTAFHMKVATAGFDDFQVWCEENNIHCLLAICDSNAKSYEDVDFAGRKAIVLGNEADGLSAEWEGLRDSTRVFIPMLGIADSLNVSVSAAILLYEATKAHPK